MIARLSGASKYERERERLRTARWTPETEAVAAFIEATESANVGETAAQRAQRVLEENHRRQGAWKLTSMCKGAELTQGVMQYAQSKRTEARPVTSP